jgi:hypothetical protein
VTQECNEPSFTFLSEKTVKGQKCTIPAAGFNARYGIVGAPSFNVQCANVIGFSLKSNADGIIGEAPRAPSVLSCSAVGTNYIVRWTDSNTDVSQYKVSYQPVGNMLSS